MKKSTCLSFIILFLFFSYTKTYADFHQEWVNRIHVANNNYGSLSLLSDRNVNTYVLTSSDTISNTHLVIKLTKYLTNGSISWSVIYNNPSNTTQSPVSFLITNNSDIFILGEASSSANNDYLILKYNSSGVFQWAYQYDSPGYDRPTAFTIDNSGNIYVTGTSNNIVNTIKVNPSGSLLWYKNLVIPNTMSNYSSNIVSDYSNNIYIQYSYTGFETKILRFLKYNTDGDTVWSKAIGLGGMTSNADFCGLQRDSSNDIYCAIEYFGMNQYGSLILNKYNTSGTLLTNFNYSGSIWGSHLNMGGFRIMNDYSLVMTAKIDSAFIGGIYKLLLCKFNSSGTQMRSIKTSYNSNFDCYGNAIALDNNSNIYVCGKTYLTTNSGDYLTIKYNSACDSQYSILYNGPANNDDYATSIVVDSNKNVYVTGFSKNADNTLSAATIKYSQLIGIKKISTSVPIHFSLSQNYPNPFNPSSKIKFQIAKLSDVQLKIYDILGREVATLVNEKLQPGTYEVDWNASNYPSGVYFYKITTEFFNQTKRMVILK